MSDALTAIDRAIADLCPCGADPAPGSAYCGDDCRPTHIADDTDTSAPGLWGAQSTAMRWRPDLVSEVDDSHRVKIGDFQRGRYHATTFEYVDSDRLHLRLDDGNRFVGLDVDGYHVPNEELEAAWGRLDRELADTRRTIPAPVDDPWADVRPVWWPGNTLRTTYGIAQDSAAPGDEVTVHLHTSPPPTRPGMVWTTPAGAGAPADPASWSILGTITDDGLRPAEPQTATMTLDNSSGTIAIPPSVLSGDRLDPLAEIRLLMQRAEEAHQFMARGLVEAMRMSQPVVQRFAEEISAFSEQGHVRFQRIATEDPEPAHPMLAAIEARRNRNTGPEQRQRPPRQIGPRRTR